MVKRICVSERDSQSLQRVQSTVQIQHATQPESYRDRVVLKPWGYEFLLFQNKDVAVWVLHLEEGHSTSMHCHPGKDTSLIVLEGEAISNGFNDRETLQRLDALVIEKGVFHSTKATSKGGVKLLEIETPPAKTDLVRLNDQYGRAGSGYEGLSEMKDRDLNRFGYFSFDENSSQAPQRHRTLGLEFELVDCNNQEQFLKLVQSLEARDLCCSFKGKVGGDQERGILDVGGVVRGETLLKQSAPFIQESLVLLRIRAS